LFDKYFFGFWCCIGKVQEQFNILFFAIKLSMMS
jgi:hypothetical protein